MNPRHLLLFCLFTPTNLVRAEILEIEDGGGETYFVIDATPDGSTNANYAEPGPFLGGDFGQVDSWGGNRRFGNAGEATRASWTFRGVPDGTYQIHVSWRNVPQGNVSLARYSGTDGLAARDLDQRVGASSLPGIVLNDGSNNVNFALLGEVTVADGDFVLTVDDSVTGAADPGSFIFADAVALGPVVITDSDGDGMPNVFEDEYGLDRNDPSDASLDADDDGLTNLEEFELGTLPNDPDFDDDGLEDGEETLTWGTSPFIADTDEDGLLDGEESGEGGVGTDPLDADTDDDGQSDGAEVAAGTNPLVAAPALVRDAENNEYLVIDNGILVDGPVIDQKIAFYREPGGFSGQDVGDDLSWNGDRRWGNLGENTAAEWTFPNLSAGTLEVFASWINTPQANLGAARYTLGTGGPSFDLEQSVGTAATQDLVLNDGARPVSFVRIGEVVFTGGDFIVTVDDTVTGSASGFIFADAIAVRLASSSTPVITGLSFLNDGTRVAVTWDSSDNTVYDLEFSEDLSDWMDVVTEVNSQGSETTQTVDLAILGQPGTGFFRVSKASP